jgi:glycosyltransferase involved in cell wall biosynthesis
MSGADGVDLGGLRICVVYDCLFPWTAGGAERWYRALAEHLAASGGSVRYLTRRQWGPANAPELPGVDVVVVMPEAELYEPDGTRKLGPPLRFGLGVFLWFLRHRGEVDVVHVANFPFFSLLAARFALLGTRAEIYVDWIEVWPREFWLTYAGRAAGSLGFVVQWLCIRLTPHALVFWHHNVARLRARGYRRGITTLAGLLPTSEISREPLTRVGSQPIALFVGRLVHDKGARLLPDVLRLALLEEPYLQLVVVGSGPEEALITAAFERLELLDHVTMPGSVSDEELARLRVEASCTVVASLREGYGLSAVESMEAGTPVVVAANPENLAVHHVVEGVNGFVVDPSPAGLARGVVVAIAKGDELRSSTRRWFVENAPMMSVDKSLHEVAELYLQRAGRRK